VDKPLANTIGRKPSLSRSGYLFRKARISPHDCDITKNWCILFYAWDIGKESLQRKRVFHDELNAIQDKSKRLALADRYIQDINYLLFNDSYLESTPVKVIPEFNFRNYSIIDAINYAMSYKKDVEGVKEATLGEYISTRTTVSEFLTHAGLPQSYKLRELSKNFLIQYFDYLKQVRNLANKTYNCRRTMLHATIEVLIRRDPKLFQGVNPFKDIAFLKTESRMHAAYSDAQMKKFAEAFTAKKENHVLLFVQFMFYSLARPNEIINLKVGNIKLQERRILFLVESAKTRIEQYVGINDRFAEIILQSRILEFPEHYYVFSNEHHKYYPGPNAVGKNYFYKRVKRYILSLGLKKLNPNYTMYSFKHSGAISLYMATRDIKLLQQQCRHQVIEQTNTYLRDLGLLNDFGSLNKWKGSL
jgi:integrase